MATAARQIIVHTYHFYKLHKYFSRHRKNSLALYLAEPHSHSSRQRKWYRKWSIPWGE